MHFVIASKNESKAGCGREPMTIAWGRPENNFWRAVLRVCLGFLRDTGSALFLLWRALRYLRAGAADRFRLAREADVRTYRRLSIRAARAVHAFVGPSAAIRLVDVDWQFLRPSRRRNFNLRGARIGRDQERRCHRYRKIKSLHDPAAIVPTRSFRDDRSDKNGREIPAIPYRIAAARPAYFQSTLVIS